MNDQLFIRLYLDEDVDVLIRELLVSRGFEVVTTRDVSNLGRSDEDQLRYAAETGLVLVTHNRVHFEALAKAYVTRNLHHAGIILATRRPPRDVANRLLHILNSVTADEMIDQVRHI